MQLRVIRHLLPLGLLFAGCTRVTIEPNWDHCTRNEGDAYCAQLFPELPFCNNGSGECSIGDLYGCVAEVRPECHAPCGDLSDDTCGVGTSSGSDTGTDSGSTSDSSDDTSSGSTGPMPCMVDEDCPDAAAPFCEPTSGECVRCDGLDDGDAACAGLDPMLPLCVGGACVACTPENPVVCDDQLLLCDGETNACAPCAEHAQCASGACELAMGRCFPEDFVVTVDGDAGAMADYTSVAAAVAAVDDGLHGVIVVHELDMSAAYQGQVLVGAGKTIALIAAPGELPIIQGTGMNPGLRVEGAATILYIDGVQVSGANDLGVVLDDAFAWVDRGRIVNNAGGGILAQNGAELNLRNCFVALNGGQFTDTRGLTASNATVSLVYTTLAANDGTAATGPISMACDAGTTGDVRNSIIASGTDTIDCSGLSFTSNVVDTGGLAGSDNDVLAFDPGWFPDIAMSDFHIASGPPFADVAQWQLGDPATDIDGDLRPSMDGTLDYAGADIPPP